MTTSTLRAASALALLSLISIGACSRGSDSPATATTSASVSGSANGSASASGQPSAATFASAMSSTAVKARAVSACNNPKSVDRRGPCKTACEMGDPSACEMMADMLRDMPVDPNGIPGGWYGYLAAACELGRASGCDRRDSAFKELRAACTKEAPKACVTFDSIVEQGAIKEPSHVIIDEALAIGCDAKNADACVRRGLHLVTWAPLDKHRPMAAKAYESACELGLAAYCCAASKMYVTDPNIPRDAAKAAALYKKGLAAHATECVDPATLPPPPPAGSVAKPSASAAKPH
jgi:TPR repeat protein